MITPSREVLAAAAVGRAVSVHSHNLRVLLIFPASTTGDAGTGSVGVGVASWVEAAVASGVIGSMVFVGSGVCAGRVTRIGSTAVGASISSHAARHNTTAAHNSPRSTRADLFIA